MLYIGVNRTNEALMQDSFIFNTGKAYIRVSTIIAHLTGGYHGIPAKILKNKAEIGTIVHSLCQKYVMGEDDVTTENTRARNYFECFKKFYSAGIFDSVIACEERFFDDDLGITGQIDLICSAPDKNDQPYIIDLKTSAQPNHLTWEIQGCLYAYMVSKTRPELNIADQVIFVQLKESGSASCFHFNWKKRLDEIIEIISEFLEKNKTALSYLLDKQLNQSINNK